MTLVRNAKVILFLIGALSAIQASGAGPGVTYHGRLMDPSGSPVVGVAVQFKIQVRSPGDNCLFHEELHTKDLSTTDGVFSVTLFEVPAAVTVSAGYPAEKIFANRGTFTFGAGLCAVGSSYTPNAGDGRNIQVSINDGGGWEEFSASQVSFVPMAVESMQVGGYKKEQLLKVADGVGTAGTEFNSTAWAELLALLGGTSAQYVKPGANTTMTGVTTFSNAPQWGGVPSGANDLVNKTYVDGAIVAGLPNVGTAGTYTKVTTDSKGRVTSGISLLVDADIPTLSSAGKVSGDALTSGTIGGSTAINSSGNLVTTGTVQGTTVSATSLRTYNGVKYVQLAAPVLGADLNFTLPASDGPYGALMKTNGSGQLSFGVLGAGDIPSLDTAKITTGTLPVARGGTGLTSFGNNSVLVSNGTGTALSSLNCAFGEVIKFDLSGFAGCGLDSSGGGSQWTTAGSNIYYNTGSVGIGTATPAYPLDVVGNIQTSGLVRTTSSGYGLYHTNGAIQLSSYLGGGYGVFGMDSGHKLAFQTSAAERMTIAATGEVGIGTTTPGAPLDVKGAIRLSGATSGYAGFQPAAVAGSMVWTLPTADGANGDFLKTDGSGNLSWAAGGGGLTGTTAGTYTTLGTNAGGSALGHTAIGVQAAFGYSGQYSTFLGYNAGGAGGSGSYNTALGYGAASTSAITGSYNTALGYNTSIGANSHGVALGSAATVTGHGGVAIGAGASAPANTVVIGSNNAGTFQERLRISSSGKAGFGTASPTDHLVSHSTGATGTSIGISVKGDAATQQAMLNFYTNNTSGSGAFGTGGTGKGWQFYANSNIHTSPNDFGVTYFDGSGWYEGFYINAGSQNFGIGTTTPATKLQVAGIISPSVTNTYTLGSSTYRFTEVYATNGVINTSDRREKKDIYDTNLGLEFINKLRPVAYRWNTGVDKDVHYGLIAQEAEKVITEVLGSETDIKTSIVSHDKKTDKYGVRYSELIAPLIKSVQELYVRILGVDRQISSVGDTITKLKTENEIQNQAIKNLEKQNAELKVYLCEINNQAPICK
ncbi:MAG: tail fiber domain-containing protein [Bdellovibrionaceae bacterium]|nr:tail fiber domain-containing protein [Pseudobdellovibrionaceae bacterium]